MLGNQGMSRNIPLYHLLQAAYKQLYQTHQGACDEFLYKDLFAKTKGWKTLKDVVNGLGNLDAKDVPRAVDLTLEIFRKEKDETIR